MKVLFLILITTILAATNSFASSKKDEIGYGNECRISKKSPTDSFPLYYKVDKVIFTSPYVGGFKTPPWESKSSRNTLVLNSAELGGGLFFNVAGKTRIEEIVLDGKKEIIQKDIFSGTLTGLSDTYEVKGEHRVYWLNGDHGFAYDVNLTIVENGKKAHNYIFECPDFDRFNSLGKKPSLDIGVQAK